MEYIYFENLKCCCVLNVVNKNSEIRLKIDQINKPKYIKYLGNHFLCVWHYISICVSITLHDRLSFRLNASRHYKRVCNSNWEFSTEQVLAVTQLLAPWAVLPLPWHKLIKEKLS